LTAIYVSVALVNACTQATAPAVQPQKKPETHDPVAFAKYSAKQPQPQENRPKSICDTSNFFGPDDLCAPAPKRIVENNPATDDLTWTLPRTPESFIWHHFPKSEQRVVVELLDKDGLPWPTHNILLENNGRHTTKLIPDYELPEASSLFLKATIFNHQDKQIEIWLQKLVVKAGAQQDAPWQVQPKKVATPTKKEKAKKKKKTRRSKAA